MLIKLFDVNVICDVLDKVNGVLEMICDVLSKILNTYFAFCKRLVRAFPAFVARLLTVGFIFDILTNPNLKSPASLAPIIIALIYCRLAVRFCERVMK